MNRFSIASNQILKKVLPILILLIIIFLLSPSIGLYISSYAETSMTLSKGLTLLKTEEIRTGMGVKSIEISPDGSSVYSMNLEDGSVFEFDRRSREIKRKIVFVRHGGKGYNYNNKTWINSFQEKPVEGHLTHNGRFLWISLHNAGGIVAWDLHNSDTHVEGRPYKSAWYYERCDTSKAIHSNTSNTKKKPYTKRKIRLLWIKTGSTPKVINSAPNGNYLFVANWHSHSVSVIKIDSNDPGDWKVYTNLMTGRIPRGLAVSPDSKYLYVAQMGSDFISVVDIGNLKKIDTIKVGVNPRHLIISNGYIYSSLNISARLVKVDPMQNSVIKTVQTLPTPRTIAISQDGELIFVVCYKANYMQIFSANDLIHIGDTKSQSHPVGVTVYQGNNYYEVWVSNYSSGTIKIFTFMREQNANST